MMFCRAIALDAMPAEQSTAGIALQDISNRQHTATAPKTQAGALKGKRPASHSLSAASEEAQSCLRSSARASWTGRPEQQMPLMCRIGVPCTESSIRLLARLCNCFVPALTTGDRCFTA